MSRLFGSQTGLSVLLAVNLACQTSAERTPAIGEAYVGPATLKIRSDIPLESATVTTVKHGERVEILRRRRRFFLVRTSAGAEGWTDERQLLSKEEMQDLRKLRLRARKMPVQGQATTFGELNVHTQPSRQSPSFLQIHEKEKVDVLMHMAVPRTELPRKPLLPPAPKRSRVVERKPGREGKYPPLVPLPKPPGPPSNWIELSRTNLPPQDLQDQEEQKPVPMDYWSLIRTDSGETGWVLTRRLVMAIPDEVAQYAEGRRIVSYFPLGAARDGDQEKYNWLWTTVGEGVHPYDFDSFRVFIWSLHRHRYETAYIERNIRGYGPVLLKEVELTTSVGKRTVAAKYPGFSICMEGKDGQHYRREYAFITNIVRFAGEHACEATPAEESITEDALAIQPEQQGTESVVQRFRRHWSALKRRWFGG